MLQGQLKMLTVQLTQLMTELHHTERVHHLLELQGKVLQRIIVKVQHQNDVEVLQHTVGQVQDYITVKTLQEYDMEVLHHITVTRGPNKLNEELHHNKINVAKIKGGTNHVNTVTDLHKAMTTRRNYLILVRTAVPFHHT